MEHTKDHGNKGMLYHGGGKAREEELQHIEGEGIMVEITSDCGTLANVKIIVETMRNNEKD